MLIFSKNFNKLAQRNLKKVTFSSNFDIFGKNGQKKNFFQSDLKKMSFSSNYSELGRHSKTLTCCSGTQKYKNYEALDWGHNSDVKKFKILVFKILIYKLPIKKFWFLF